MRYDGEGDLYREDALLYCSHGHDTCSACAIIETQLALVRSLVSFLVRISMTWWCGDSTRDSLVSPSWYRWLGMGRFLGSLQDADAPRVFCFYKLCAHFRYASSVGNFVIRLHVTRRRKDSTRTPRKTKFSDFWFEIQFFAWCSWNNYNV